MRKEAEELVEVSLVLGGAGSARMLVLASRLRYRGLYSKGELEVEPGQISLLLKSSVPRSEVWRSWEAGSAVVSLAMLSRREEEDPEMFPNLEFCLTAAGIEMSSSKLRLILSRGP